MVTSVSSVIAEAALIVVTPSLPVPDELRVEVAALVPAMVPPRRRKMPLVESSVNKVGTFILPVMFTVPAVPALARVKVPNWSVLKVPPRLSVPPRLRGPPLAVMSSVPGGALAPSLFQAPVRDTLPPSTRTVPWFSKLPAMVSVLPVASLVSVPWLRIDDPGTALTLWSPALATVTPGPTVSTPPVVIWRRFALLPLPARRTVPLPDSVWVPSNSREVKDPSVEDTVMVRPAAMPRPSVTFSRAPLPMVTSVSSVIAEALPPVVTSSLPVPVERTIDVAGSTPAMAPPRRLKTPLPESSRNTPGTFMVPVMLTVPAVPAFARVKLPN